MQNHILNICKKRLKNSEYFNIKKYDMQIVLIIIINIVKKLKLNVKRLQNIYITRENIEKYLINFPKMKKKCEICYKK
jgi:hypothetical protein